MTDTNDSVPNLESDKPSKTDQVIAVVEDIMEQRAEAYGVMFKHWWLLPVCAAIFFGGAGAVVFIATHFFGIDLF